MERTKEEEKEMTRIISISDPDGFIRDAIHDELEYHWGEYRVGERSRSGVVRRAVESMRARRLKENEEPRSAVSF